jgi:hypothetical protein
VVESRVQSRKQPIFAAQGIQNSTRDPALLTDNLNYMTTYGSRVNQGLNRCPVSWAKSFKKNSCTHLKNRVLLHPNLRLWTSRSRLPWLKQEADPLETTSS